MDRYFRDRIQNITDADFWSSIMPSPAPQPALRTRLRGRS